MIVLKGDYCENYKKIFNCYSYSINIPCAVVDFCVGERFDCDFACGRKNKRFLRADDHPRMG